MLHFRSSRPTETAAGRQQFFPKGGQGKYAQRLTRESPPRLFIRGVVLSFPNLGVDYRRSAPGEQFSGRYGQFATGDKHIAA